MALLAYALALWSSGAAPPADTVEIRWQTPAACVSEQQFREELTTLAPAPPAEPVEFGAELEPDGAWVLTIGFADVERSLRGRDCRLLTAAAALVVAVRIDPVVAAASLEALRVQRPQQGSPTPPAPAEPSEATPPPPVLPTAQDQEEVPESGPATPPALAAQRSVPPPRLVGGLSVGADVGTLPRNGAALSADIGARWRRARVEAGGFAVLGPASRPNGQNVRATFRVFSAAVRGCGIVATGKWEAPLCGGLELGVVQARPSGLQSPNDVDALWLAPVLGVRLQRWLGVVAPLFYIDVAVPLLQHSFETGDAGTLHRLPPVVVRTGLGIRFGAR